MKNERELYQEHYKTNRDYKFYIKHEMTEKQVFEFKDGKYVVECVNDGWKIWQASANRDGYKLVPCEPTYKQLDALKNSCELFKKAGVSDLEAHGAYKAMIRASK